MADTNAEEPLFTCEYTYTDDLIRTFARVQMSGKRRGMLLISGLALAAIGLIWIFEPQSLHWLGLLPLAFGIYCIWLRSNLWRGPAKREIALMDGSEERSGGRWRHLDVDEGGITVRVRDGRTQRYDFAELTNFENEHGLYVVIFGTSGVAVPAGSFTRGTASEFGRLLTSKLYPAGSMGPDTPNR